MSCYITDDQYMSKVDPDEADMAWLVYDLAPDPVDNRYILTKVDTIYTRFKEALDEITKSQPGDQNDFVKLLQGKLDEKLGGPLQHPRQQEVRKNRDD